MYSVEVRHDGLHKYRVIKGNDRYVVDQKASPQLNSNGMKCGKKSRKQKEKELNERKYAIEKTQKKSYGRTTNTKRLLHQLETINNTLHHTLDVDDKIDWDSLKDMSRIC